LEYQLIKTELMRKRVLIIDDETDARMLLRQYIQPHEQLEIIGECENGQEAVQMIYAMEPDLVFLDIKMPGLNGFQVVQQIIHVPLIIFTTAYNQYALKAFDSNAIDYLLKPYTAERFNRAITKLLNFTSANPNKAREISDEITGNRYFSRLLVEAGNKFINLAAGDILYIEAEKDYCRLHTDHKSYMSNYGIGTMEQRMDPANFIRIHRSYIVNIHHIKEVHKDGSVGQAVMRNNKALNISRTYMEDLKKLLY
jgi:two-component system LytT family response regulator